MHSAPRSRNSKCPVDISTSTSEEPRRASMKPAAAIIRRALLPAVLCALLLFARPAQAQTETVLYNFAGSDGYEPQTGLVSDSAGNLYGTTLLGGLGCPGNENGCGVVFEVSPNGSGGWNETMLHSFSGPPDGANPFLAPMIVDKAGNLYGTTEFGGTYNYGAIFKLTPTGTSWTITVLYSFSNYNDGGHPAAGLIMDAAGNLYGITSEYQSPGCVFELTPSDGGWIYQVIYATDTWGGLTMDASGNIFGYTGSDTVFELSPNGSGGWNSAVIHAFAGAPKDGDAPQGNPVLDQAGNLYGTTYYGGANNSGTVFKLIRPTKKWQKGEWKVEILHSFGSGKEKKDGSNPYAGIVFDANGKIYGTTNGGGKLNDGTVFELAQTAQGWYQEKILWSFNGTDGLWPRSAPVLDSEGNLYGTTVFGGLNNDGVVFEVTP